MKEPIVLSLTQCQLSLCVYHEDEESGAELSTEEMKLADAAGPVPQRTLRHSVVRASGYNV